METPKQFYSCCNGDSLAGHKAYCLKPIFENPDYHVFFDDDKNPTVMFVSVPVKMIAENCHKNSTMFFRGYWEEVRAQAIQCIQAIWMKAQAGKNKILTPGRDGNRPPQGVFH
jgi:hypothetical protein